MTDVVEELRERKNRKPFEPFAIILNDGRRFLVHRRFQYAFTDERVVVFDERDLTNLFRPSDISQFETPQPVG